MVFLGAVVLPHGAMPFDGDAESASPACRERYARLDPTLRDNLSAVRAPVYSIPGMLGLEAWPRPRGLSRLKFCGLGLEGPGLGLEGPGLGLEGLASWRSR